MDEDVRGQLESIVKAAQAYLEVEAELGGPGLPLEERVASLRAAEASRPLPVASSLVPERAAPIAQSPAPPKVPQPVASQSVPVAAAMLVPDGLGDEDKRVRLTQLAAEVTTCTACVLHEKRTQTVFARGSSAAELVFVGEGPGAEEDRLGQPFVGPAGQLLDRMITAMGYARDDVYICNVVKCRPPENRTPRAEEAIACSRYLVPQLQLVAPKVIVALGRCAAQNLGVAKAEGPWRGRWGEWHGVPVLPTYHPAFLLRSPEFKRTVWEDLQLVMGRLGRTPPQRG